ncbi:MAG: exonuclease [Alphaproteobacteria bacterium]|nr:MAG: exonuclease [Alphaproteobacteria bacterium]
MNEALTQGTPEWFAARLGKATASRIADITARTKSGWGAARANYLAELVAERLTGEPADSYTSPAMQWGTDTEPEAREAYAFVTGSDVEPVGFVDHPEIAMSGASPDGLVGDAGLVEIKCPNTATHIKTVLADAVPGKYIKQMMWQMACTGREWCDFVSYDPRLPLDVGLYVRRIERDAEQIAELEAQVREFLAEVDETVRKLRAKAEGQAA